MAGGKDDRSGERFRPRIGRPKSGGDRTALPKAKRFVSRVLIAANRSGPSLRARPGAARMARGATVARLIGQHGHSGRERTARRVAVKVRLVHLKAAGSQSMRSHLAYIQRDAVGPDGEKGQAYGRDGAADPEGFEAVSRDDRHQFRMIVAPEDGEALGDLQGYTRDLIARMEHDLGTRLDWVAVDHHDTGHAHSHVVLRGVDDHGEDLVIARAYIGHGIRTRASEIATQWLGPRTGREILASLERETVADHWTGLDRRLESLAGTDRAVTLDGASSEERAALRGRLRHLEQLGLASRDDDGWRLSHSHQATLRALGECGDIIRTMQRAMGANMRELAMPVAEEGWTGLATGTEAQPIVGRIVAKGLVDELDDRGWLAVDAIDGRAHYLRLPRGSDLASWPVGGIVEAPGGERAVDRAIASAARNGIYTPPAGGDDATARARDGAVRRLEALRRAGVVERLGTDIWSVPHDLVARGAAHDRAQGGRLILRSPVGLAEQVDAVGATWLDRGLIAEHRADGRDAATAARGRGNRATAIARTGFGAEVHKAFEDRIAALEAQGLAERRQGRLLLARNLLGTLEARDLAEAGKAIAAETGLAFRPSGDGRVAGKLTRVVDRPSGRFAMLDDGAGGFALVPWRPVLEHRIGQSLSASIQGSSVSWHLGRTRDVGM